MNKLILVMAIPFLCSCSAKYRVLPENQNIAKQPSAAKHSKDVNKGPCTLNSWSVCPTISSASHLLWNDNPAIVFVESISNNAKDKSITGVSPQDVPTTGRLTTGPATINQEDGQRCYPRYSEVQVKSFSVANGFYRLTEKDPAVDNVNGGLDKNRSSRTGETLQANDVVINGFMEVDITN